MDKINDNRIQTKKIQPSANNIQLVKKSKSKSQSKKNNGSIPSRKKISIDIANGMTLADDFYDVVNIANAIDAKKKNNELLVEQGLMKKKLNESNIKNGIEFQHLLTTKKIKQMLSNAHLTPEKFKAHEFSKFSKVILVDFENLWNVNLRSIPNCVNIINEIQKHNDKAPILFIFIMARYHVDNKVFTILSTQFNKSVVADHIYIDCNIDNLSDKSCLEQYGFNESDDYLLLKLYKYLTHHKISTEILSADKYSYYKGPTVVYTYLSEKIRIDLVKSSEFNPVKYYEQFNPVTETKETKEIKQSTKNNKTKKNNNVISTPHPKYLRRTGEYVRVRTGNDVYYTNGSKYDKKTKKIYYSDGGIGTAYGHVFFPDGTIEYPNGMWLFPNGIYQYPYGKIIYPNGQIIYPPGSLLYDDGTIVYEDGTHEYVDGTIKYPDGMTEYQDGTIHYPENEIIIYTDGTIKTMK